MTVPVRFYGSTGHIASGSIQQGVDSSVAGKDVVAVLLHFGDIQYVGFQEHGFTSILDDISHDGFAYLTLSAEDDHLCAFGGEVFGNSTTEHACAARDDHHVVLDVKEILSHS